MKGLCFLSAVPMRQQPSDKAEMVNQLLFGDTFSIVESQPKWSLVRCDADGYEGWVDNKQYLRLTAEEYNKIESTWCATGLRAGTVEVDGSLLPLPMGSRCPEPNDSPEQMAGMTFRTRWVERGEGLLQNAQQLLGSPYLWGGRTLMGIDCSGFTQVVFRSQGIALLRDASQQATQGIAVEGAARPGDLCFFQNDAGRIVHVGICMGDGRIIHASGRVRIDRIDGTGIYDESAQEYTHRFHSARRIWT